MRRIPILGTLFVAATLYAQAPPPQAETWAIDGDVQGTPVKMTCVLTDTAHKLTGVCTGADGKPSRNLTGEVTEKGLTWRFETDYQGEPITLTMTATRSEDGKKMDGIIFVSLFNADGIFTATRTPPRDTPSPTPQPGTPPVHAV